MLAGWYIADYRQYAFVAYSWLCTVHSIFCDDPIDRANQRGYVLR